MNHSILRIALAMAAVAAPAGCTVYNVPPPAGQPGAPPPAAEPPPPAPVATAAPATSPVTPAPTPAPVTTAAPPPSSGGFAETTEPSQAALEMKLSAVEGRPRGLRGGAPPSLWIWKDAKGKGWHVRATAHAEKHRFRGTILGDGGPITQLRSMRAELNDRVRATPRGVTFDFQTQADEDGFDFVVAGTHCVRFYTSVDGRSETGLVTLGATDAHPPHSYFKLCP
jgi:hypothetical protein